jgi:uncharacterized protein YbjT (DUF2867 family)
MNITLTGSLGNISRRIAEQLIAQGHDVTVISHDPEKKAAIEAMGATAAIGSIEDVSFLVAAFSGARAVYTMVPPSRDTSDMEALMKRTGAAYAQAIESAGVKHIVNLSGIGAHQATGNGPSGNFFYVEQSLNELQDVHVLHLQPAMFYTNFFGSIGMIRQQQVIGNNFGPEVPVLLTHPHDIANLAAEALDTLSFEGKTSRYVVSDRRTGAEIARELGNAIGKQELSWLTFSDEQLLNGVVQNGFSRHMAANFVEMGQAIQNGKIYAEFEKNGAKITGDTKLPDFAREFAAVYGATH